MSSEDKVYAYPILSWICKVGLRMKMKCTGVILSV